MVQREIVEKINVLDKPFQKLKKINISCLQKNI